jgi:hypothetical protein
MIENTEYGSVRFIPHTRSSITLDNLSSLDRMCVYCACGRIVALDRSEMQLKISLGKELQCTVCRNARISQEIDSMNSLFEGIPEEECL